MDIRAELSVVSRTILLNGESNYFQYHIGLDIARPRSETPAYFGIDFGQERQREEMRIDVCTCIHPWVW